MKVIIEKNTVTIQPEVGDDFDELLRAMKWVEATIPGSWLLYTPPGGNWVFMPDKLLEESRKNDRQSDYTLVQ